MSTVCHPRWLGQMEFGAALSLQKELTAQRAANEIPNTLLLLEHPPTFSVGIGGHREHLLVNQQELVQRNVAYHWVDRGGSVTYHGPGQLICYPILRLDEPGQGYHHYLKLLESVIIRTLTSFRVRAFRGRGQPGVWVFAGNTNYNGSQLLQTDQYHMAQIASIGVKLDQNHVTSHGFSININPDLTFFDLIIPRGLPGCRVTSLVEVVGKSVEISSVLEPVVQSFCEIFKMERTTLEPSVPALLVS